MKKTNSNYSRAFTLVEMLVVIAIIAILAGILVPVVARSKLKAKVAVTRVQIKELENAIKMYKSDYSRFPAPKGCITNEAGDFSVGEYDGGSRFVVIEFQSQKAADDFWYSEEYAGVKKLRDGASRTTTQPGQVLPA